MAPKTRFIRRKSISARPSPPPVEDQPKSPVEPVVDEETVSEDLAPAKDQINEAEEDSEETPVAAAEDSPATEASMDEAPSTEAVKASAVVEDDAAAESEEEDPPSDDEADEQEMDVDPISVAPKVTVSPDLKKKKKVLASPDLKQKGVASPAQKVASKRGPSTGPSAVPKLLHDAMKSGDVASRAKLKRKSPEIVTKSQTKATVKKTKAPGIFVPELSPYVSQEDIDKVLEEDRKPSVDIAGRQIAASKRIDFSWFSANDLDVAPLFEAIGLKAFCEAYAEVAVARIKEFYSNISFHAEGLLIKTIVDGATLVFSAHDVNVLFGCEEHDPLSELGKAESYSIILGRKASVPKYLESTRLELKERVLHRAVLFCLLPRSGSMDTITPNDAQLMAHIIRGIPFNVGEMIFNHMKKCWKLSGKALPYGQVIAGLLKMHGFDANPAHEQEKWRVGTFGSQIIASMQYMRTASGWTLKGKSREPPQKVQTATAKPAVTAPAVKAFTAPTPKGSTPAEEGSASSTPPSFIQDLQRQVVANGEDIRVLQRLVMDLIRAVERQEKFLRDNLEVSPTDAE